MSDLENEEITLMSTEEYMCLRKKAIKKLKNNFDFDESRCIVGGTRVRIEEKEILLNQLICGYEYLKVPISLYLTDEFWRILKAESNKRIRKIKIQDIKE